MFSGFDLLRGRCELLPFPSALVSLCTPGGVPNTLEYMMTTDTAVNLIHLNLL